MAIIKPELPVDKKKIMWHTVIHINTDNVTCGVEVTTNPYEHQVKAALIMHKTASLNVAKQVARYVRRATGQRRVSIHRAGVSREAMIGYAVSRTEQFAPNERTPYRDLVDIISQTSVGDLLKMGDTSDNASRSRFYVFEVRDGNKPIGRFISNKVGSVEKIFLNAPPDTCMKAGIFSVFQSPDYETAEKERGPDFKYEVLWTRKPPHEYLVKVLRVNNSGEFEYSSTGFSAMRRYSTGDFVQIGPHLYTLGQVKVAFAFGYWEDGRVTKKSLEFLNKEGADFVTNSNKLDARE